MRWGSHPLPTRGSEFTASGTLQLTPVDPGTGSPTGASYAANVSEHQIASFAHEGGMIDGIQVQTERPRTVSGHGRKLIHLRVRRHSADLYRKDIDCRPLEPGSYGWIPGITSRW